MITSSTGTIQQESDFLPYGTERVITVGDTNRYKFTGKERDSESGFDYFGARHYTNPMGRFMSPDGYNAILISQHLQSGGLPTPAADTFLNGYFENPQNWNQYSYVRNNPLRFVDPSGAVPLGGHHLIPVRRALTGLARSFADWVRTGPPTGDGSPNQPGCNEMHLEYNEAVDNLLSEKEQTLGKLRNDWDLSEWRQAAQEILDSDEPAIKDFLDELEAHNPGAKAALATAIATYRVSSWVLAGIITRALVSELMRLPTLFWINVKELTSPHRDLEADRKPPHQRCLQDRAGNCVD